MGRSDAHQLAFAELTPEVQKEFIGEAILALSQGSSDLRLIELLAQVEDPLAWLAIEKSLTGPPHVAVAAARALWKSTRDLRAFSVFSTIVNAYLYMEKKSWIPSLLMADFPEAFDLVKKAHSVPCTTTSLCVEQAVDGLLEIGSPEALSVVIQVIEARDGILQMLAMDGLFKQLRLDCYDWVSTSPVWSLRLRLTSRFQTVRKNAIQRLFEIVSLRKTGADDLALDVIPKQTATTSEMQTLLENGRDASKPFDVLALNAVQGDERIWAIEIAMKALERDEIRGEVALKHLGGPLADLILGDYHAGRMRPM